MKALIVLENHFFEDVNGRVWCDRVVDYNFLKRYLKVFEEIIVCGRMEKVQEEVKDKLLVSGEHVKVIGLPDFIGAKGLIKNLSKIKKILRGAIKETNCTIYRAPTHISLFTYKEVLKQKKVLALEFMMAADKMVEGDGFVSNLANKLIKKKAQKMCMKANGVSYVTERVLQEEYPCKAIKSKNTNEYFTENYSTIELKEEDYNSQNWDKDNKPEIFKIIHTGYMDSYRKGQDTLIKAIKEVTDKGYSVQVTLVGDGRKREEFENMVKEFNLKDVVKFAGLVKDKSKILELLHDSHMLVFPTHSEGLPRTIIEAMSQGLPCISSPVDGVPELVEENWLVDYNDVHGYANKIIEMISDWNKMIEISKNNFEKSKKYRKDVLDQKRTGFYQKIYKLGCEKNG